MTLWLTAEYSRAGRGGMGAAKTGGNYASSLIAQQEATAHGCDQVVFLDSEEQKYVEELGGMNLYFVHADGRIVTPADRHDPRGHHPRQHHRAGRASSATRSRSAAFSIDEWRDGVTSGDITEIFACGTAAVVTPVGRAEVGGRRGR